ncbi:MAG: C10 family peptidase [Kiritimatiellae bacterium]|nr:C10 family peptidase [Kiritimatiellia bacterium]
MPGASGSESRLRTLKRWVWGILLALPLAAGAAEVSLELAGRVAEHWLARSAVFRAAAERLPAGESFGVKSVVPLLPEGADPPMAYHAAVEPRGYVIVSADTRISPVLCFSPDADLNLIDDPQNALRAMLLGDLRAARAALAPLDGNVVADAVEPPAFVVENQARWAELLRDMEEASAPRAPTYAPTNILVVALLETTWSQWNHYNELCPDDPYPGSGYDGKVPVGCVPVAGAQTLKYHDWPPYGRGTHTYTDANIGNAVTGVFSAVFSDAYDWANMQADYDVWGAEPSNAEAAVSALIHELGVATEINYGSYTYGGSSAGMRDLRTALNTHFFYAYGTYALRNGDPAAFDAALRQEILAERPCPASYLGHAFVIDGLADEGVADYYHINYGWGGQDDGWYQLSNINGNSCYDAIFGAVPLFMPLLARTGGGTNDSGSFTLCWSFPKRRQAELTAYRLREGLFAAAHFNDTADDLDNWEVSGDWYVDTPGNGGSGSCFRKSGGTGTHKLTLADAIKPSAETVLQYAYKAILADDHFYVQLSTNAGDSWIELCHLTGTGWDPTWYSNSIDLSAYAGMEAWIRFQYVMGSGSQYGEDGAVWLDDIAMSNGERLAWTVLDGAIASNATDYPVAGRADNTYYYALQACDGSNWHAWCPPESVVVALDPDLDVDSDGMPNGWEEAYFGSVTGATAGADADADGFSNWAEYWAGSNPGDSNSFFAIAHYALAPGGPTFEWPSVSGRTYAVWRATNLNDALPFGILATNLAATPDTNTYTDTNAPGAGPHFYEVEVEAE